MQLIHRALELGITFFDTGDVYGKGANEEIVARALAGVPRESVQLSTKFGYVLDEGRQEHSQGERPQDWSPAHARKSLEASLRRLGTDYVDLYQLHNPRMDAIERDDLFEELERAEGRGQAAPLRRRAGTGDRLARRGHARARGARHHVGPDRLQRARAGPRPRLPRRRGGARARPCWRASRPRAACSRTSTRSRRPSRSTTIAATARASGSWRACRRSSACASCARSTGSRWPRPRCGSSSRSPRSRACCRRCRTPRTSRSGPRASDAPDLTADDLERISELYERNFDVEPVSAVAARYGTSAWHFSSAAVSVACCDAVEVGLLRRLGRRLALGRHCSAACPGWTALRRCRPLRAVLARVRLARGCVLAGGGVRRAAALAASRAGDQEEARRSGDPRATPISEDRSAACSEGAGGSDLHSPSETHRSRH